MSEELKFLLKNHSRHFWSKGGISELIRGHFLWNNLIKKIKKIKNSWAKLRMSFWAPEGFSMGITGTIAKENVVDGISDFPKDISKINSLHIKKKNPLKDFSKKIHVEILNAFRANP